MLLATKAPAPGARDDSGLSWETSTFKSVNVEAELLKLSTEGMTVIEQGVHQNLFSGVHQFFSDLVSRRISLSDGHLIELRASKCFKHVDRLCATCEATAVDLRQLRNHTVDILVLASSRFVDPWLLQDRGLPQKLKERLASVLGVGAHAITNNLRWLSLFGTSKHAIFHHGVSWNSRRRACRGRGTTSCEVRVAVASSDEAFMDESVEDIAVAETETQHLMGL